METGENRLGVKGEFKDNKLVREEAGTRQYLNYKGGEINKLLEVNHNFSVDEIKEKRWMLCLWPAGSLCKGVP